MFASTSLETTLTADTLTASSSFEKKTELVSTPTDLELSELSFNFPKKGDEVYIGCTYPISWQPSTIINSLEAGLIIDVGAKKSVGPIEGSLVKEIDPQNLSWKVGVMVWPGEYYIKVLKINDVDVEIRSEVFTIKNIPKGLNTAERAKICNKSGGLF